MDEETKILDRLRELDKIIDSAECNELSNYLSFKIMDLEESLHELNLAVSNEWLRLREVNKSNAQTDKLWEISDIYQNRERVKLTMQQLKRLRSDLRNRFDILTMKRF